MRNEANLSSEESVAVRIWNARSGAGLGGRARTMYSLLTFLLVFNHSPLFEGSYSGTHKESPAGTILRRLIADGVANVAALEGFSQESLKRLSRNNG